MPTFLPGPGVSTCPPVTQSLFEQRNTLRHSRDRPTHHHSSPYRNKAHHHAQHDIKQAEADLASLDGEQCFVFEAGKSCVASDETDGDQISPVRTPLGSCGHEGVDNADEKRTRDINYECPVGKARSH